MLLTEFQSSLLAWGIAGLVAAVGVAAGISLIRRESRAGLPVIVMGVVAALFAQELSRGTRVLVVIPGDGRPARRDLRVYAGSTYRFADGSSERLQWNSARQLVLNDTPVPMTVAKVQHGATWAEPDEARVEPYQSVKVDGRIDHFSPEDLPPRTSEKWERYWLRW